MWFFGGYTESNGGKVYQNQLATYNPTTDSMRTVCTNRNDNFESGVVLADMESRIWNIGGYTSSQRQLWSYYYDTK